MTILIVNEWVEDYTCLYHNVEKHHHTEERFFMHTYTHTYWVIPFLYPYPFSCSFNRWFISLSFTRSRICIRSRIYLRSCTYTHLLSSVLYTLRDRSNFIAGERRREEEKKWGESSREELYMVQERKGTFTHCGVHFPLVGVFVFVR